MLAEAFEALKTYDWGTDRAPLAPIDDAVATAKGEQRKELEEHLLTALKSNASRDAKDYVCRKLAIVGTAASVPTLAGLLSHKNHSHMARYALERMPASEAAKALRDALPNLDAALKVGVISSIGARRDSAAVPALSKLLADRDASIARAAAIALGDIGDAAAVKALQAAKPAKESKRHVLDAQLTCAEALLARNDVDGARAIYQSLAADDQAKLVRLAATRGMLACAAKSV